MIKQIFWFACCLQIGLIQSTFTQAPSHEVSFAKVQAIFNDKCIDCHGGEEPAAGMSLEQGSSYRNLINTASFQIPSMNRITPNDADASYLYRKVLQQPDVLSFAKQGMPLRDDKLSDNEIDDIKNWIRSFPSEMWGDPAVSHDITSQTSSETFLATQLINLPTTHTLGTKTAEFRILHRFASINGGGHHTLGSFFGLDNGAITSINFSVGINSNTDLLIRRTGENKDIEVAVKYVPIEQTKTRPVTLGLYAGFDWISRSDIIAKNRFSPNLQLLASSRFNDRLSVLLAPGITFRSNHSYRIIKQVNDSVLHRYKDSRSTLAVGIGFQYNALPNTAITGEYIPRVSGYKGNKFAGDSRYNTWALGLAYKIRLHVFQVLLSNSQSIHTTQYLPGSPDKAVPVGKWFEKGPSFHFGFNIYRQFKW